MKGKILDYNIQESKGIISGDDGQRYSFENKDWKASELPKVNQIVDFEVDENQAKSVYAIKMQEKNSNTTLLLLVIGISLTIFGLYFLYLAIFDVIDVYTLLTNSYIMKFQNSIDNSVTKFIIITLVEIVVAFVSLQIGIKILKVSGNPQTDNIGEIILKSMSTNQGIKK
ncbi:hypothetical protein [Aliarcobacter cryaerophilus]|uniref:hypothetical protein n=1 Tax=Aliarcobacter cryaerophilus TaxID=28198 RepID=UPI0021B32D7B|nr:hypothetical protein [Aliarcobacter cryaerophilus]MCT7445451.1 hypothetical protein [Aliarcobacter cryaerophilus]MCT7480236.1 hypothetical protein [Aliarcobacter cryaerophilus]MCT7514946.1 hypothetical protein [Aliarcobacter cryaerophilus]